MRIYNKHSGSSGLGGESRDSREAEKRQQLFRQNKKIGQEVQGTVLSLRGKKVHGQAWIDVGGLALSAQLPFEAQPGQRLLLRIESLEPEIVLKFLKQIHGSSAGLQVQVYTALCNQLHNVWQDFWHNLLAARGETGEIRKFFSKCSNSEPNNLSTSSAGDAPNNAPAKSFANLLELSGFRQLSAWASIASLIAAEVPPENLQPTSATHGLVKSNLMNFETCFEPLEALQAQSLQAGPLQAGPLQAGEGLALGDPFPDWLVNMGENLVSSLHKIWSEQFVSNLPSQAQKELGELNSIQLATVRSLASKGVRAWSQIPWASPNGSQSELLILRPDGQKLEQVFISGMWPGLGGVCINAMALNGQISCRVQVQNLLPFEQVVQIINLPGLGKIYNLVAAKYNLPSKHLSSCANLNSEKALQAQNKIICLELKQHPPDTVAGLLLRL